MALAFSGGDNDVVNHGVGSSHHNLATGTVLVWMYQNNTNNTLRFLASKRTGAFPTYTGWIFFKPGADGTSLRFQLERATTDLTIVGATGTLTTGWQCVAATWDLAGADTDQHEYRGTLTSSLSEISYASRAVGSGAQVDDSGGSLYGGGGISDSTWFSWEGTVALIAIWNRQLSLGELQAQQWHPHVTSGCILFSHYGFAGTGTQPDWSGNGNAGTVTGATVGDHVPLGPAFGWPAGLPYVVAAGGAYNQSAAGTLTSAGTALKATGKQTAGTLATVGALLRATAKSASGTLTSAGASLKATAKNVAGALTSSGALTAAHLYVQTVAGTLTSAGTTLKGASKLAAGTLTTAGATLKTAAKVLAGTLTSSGALSTLRSIAQSVEGTLTSSGALVKATAKSAAGTLTTAGTTLRATAKNVAGTLTSSGVSLKATAKNMAGTLSSSGAVAAARSFLQAVAGTLSSSGAVMRSTAKNVAGSLTSGGAIRKAIGKTIAGILGLAGTVARLFSGESTPDLLDVALSDTAVYSIALTTSAVYVVTVSDSAVYTVTLSDSTRS